MIRATTRRNAAWIGFIAPCVLILVSFVIFPLVYSLRLSFTNLALTFPDYRYIGFENFADLVRSSEAVKTLVNTGLVVAGAVGVELVLGLGIAFLLNKAVRGRSLLVTLIVIPSLIAPTAVGVIWKLVLQPNGLSNYIVSLIGVNPIDWFGNPRLALGSIIIADIWQWTPFVSLILLAGLTSIDTTLYEAADVDGASSWQRFRFITLPELQTVLVFAMLFRAIDVVRFMDKVWMMTRGGPGISSQTAAVFIYREGFRYFRIGYSSAASWLLMIIIIIFTTLLLHFIKENA